MKADTIHPVEEFHLLPWDKLRESKLGSDWTYARGGHGLECGQWHIDVFKLNSGICQDIWVVPAAFNAIIESQAMVGVDKAQREIRNALGI